MSAANAGTESPALMVRAVAALVAVAGVELAVILPAGGGVELPRSVALIVRLSGEAAASTALGVPESVQVPAAYPFPDVGTLVVNPVIPKPVPAGSPVTVQAPFIPPTPPVTGMVTL